MKEMSKIKYPELPSEIRKLLDEGWTKSQVARKLSEKYKTHISRQLVQYHVRDREIIKK